MNVRANSADTTSVRQYRYLGQRLRQARTYLGYSREQISSELNIEPTRLIELEMGIRKASDDYLTKFSHLYGRSVDWLASNDTPYGTKAKNHVNPRPWRFFEEDYKEFLKFRQVIETSRGNVELSDKLQKIGKFTYGDDRVQELHEALDTYDSALRTGYVDIFKAATEIGLTTFLRPISFVGALFLTDKGSGLMLSVSETLSTLRFATASSLARLSNIVLQDGLNGSKLWYSLKLE